MRFLHAAEIFCSWIIRRICEGISFDKVYATQSNMLIFEMAVNFECKHFFAFIYMFIHTYYCFKNNGKV
jgi:hypothetical protein